ncbi:MAG: NAD(P)H-hydrate epimerase [Brevefilum sp.]
MSDLSNLPLLTTAQMVEVDRLMIEDWGISLVQMMENAGHSLAELVRHNLGGSVAGKNILVMSGGGNNGGGGMVAARHLHNWGAVVQLTLIGEEKRLKDVPAQQYSIIQRMGLVTLNPDFEAAEVIIDAIIGYGLTGDPRPPVADWIGLANASGKPILALDTPSGLNTTTGIPSPSCIRAAATLTLAMPKVGLVTQQAQPFVGDLYLADISVPPELYAAPSLDLRVISPFSMDSIIKLS